MTRYLIRRLLQMIPLLLATSIVAFLVMHLAPGDPTSMYWDPQLGSPSPEDLRLVRQRLGLDQPPHVQYVRWLINILQGEWGYSLINRRSVWANVWARLPNTLLLGGLSILISLAVAIPLGVLSAVKRYTAFDYLATTLIFTGISTPVFWFALLLMYVFAVRLGWLPSVGMHSVREQYTGWAAVVDVGRHLILPVTVLVTHTVAEWTRYMRSGILEIIGQDYLRTARAKGLPERTVLLRHALRNALIPMITLLGISIPNVVTCSIITETVFGWPGMGRLSYDAILSRDYPVIMSVILMFSSLVILGNLLADLAYAWIDPRVQYQ